MLCSKNDKDEGTKEDFYNKLQTVLDKMKEKDITILMGDFNAKIGSNNRGYEEVMGTHGIGEMNENGEMFADLCSFNRLIIGGSVFPHRRIHKATWVSPDHRTENQIDHICISHKFRRSMQDVRVHRGADAASDHHLVVTKLKLKLKSRVEKRKNRTRYNVEFLKDKEKKETFRLTLSNKYETLQELLDEENMEVNPPSSLRYNNIIMAGMAVFNVAGYLIEERRRWPVITASPRGQCSK